MSSRTAEQDRDAVTRSTQLQGTVNQAEQYDVRIVPASANADDVCWRVVSVRHLLPDENRGKHNVYVDAVDEAGQPLRGGDLCIGWSWEGRNEGEAAPPVPLDKPQNEPGGNVSMFSGQRLQVWIQDGSSQSDRVENLHTNHSDEQATDGALGNTIGHHSFHILFQRTRRISTPAVEKVPPVVVDQVNGTPLGSTGVHVFPTTAPGVKPSFYPDYIFGIHESGGEEHMTAASCKGWVLELAEIGLDGNNAHADFRRLADQGFGVIVRINHGYGSTGTLPTPDHYSAFAAACKRYVDRSAGCHIWIIGNEPNHENEWPNGQPITPNDYVLAYTQCRNAIRSLPDHENDQVLIAGPAPWNNKATYPGNERGDWVKYLADTLTLLPENGCDGITIHTYTHDLRVEQITNDFWHDAPGYTHLRNEFRTYRDFMAAIPPHLRRLPVFITETDPTDPGKGWRDGHDIGWVQAAYREIADWNSDPNNQPIVALLLYRWPPHQHHGQREWSISDRPGIVEDFKKALRLTPADRFRIRMPVAQPATSVKVTIPAIFTNQQLIDAFFNAAKALGVSDYRDLLIKAGLSVDVLAQERQTLYSGPGLDHLPNLNAQEKAALQRGLLTELLSTARWLGIANATAGLNLRTGPGSEYELITTLPHETIVQVLSEQGDWLFVIANGSAGFVHRQHVIARVEAPQPAPTPVSPPVVPAPTPVSAEDLAPTLDQRLPVPAGADEKTKTLINIWNSCGKMIQEEANRLNISPEVAVAVLAVESSGRGFAADGRMIIRFENHLFNHYWGKANQARFDQHFRFSPDKTWQGHEWRADANSGWQTCHASQEVEWQVFNFARQLDETAAMKSISMGAPQVMGFNHHTVGYPTVQAMFQEFQGSLRSQLSSLFKFMEVNGLTETVRKGDYETFAQVYNGIGQKEFYGRLIREHVGAFPTPRAAVASERGAEPADARGAVGRLPLPVPTINPGGVMDEELYKAWRKHIEQGFNNNQTMFSQILNGFMNPYWTTVWMYRLLFGLGIASFVAAVAISIMTGQQGFALIFGGFSALSILAYFFNRPLQALEENLQFITWLGIIYNTYWTHLAYSNDTATIHEELEDATNGTISKIKELMDKHAERGASRPRFGP